MKDSHTYVLITGATSGIGYELARLFAKDKYNLIIVSRNQQELDQRAHEFRSMGVEVVVIAKNLFHREEVFALYDQVLEAGLQVEILVNDAGQGLYGQFKDTDIDRELKIIDLNVSSLVILTKCFLRDMVARKSGKILNLASIASKSPGPWQSVYHSSKAFVLSFTEAICEELKDTCVTVTALLPGVTDTDFFNNADMQTSKAVQDKDAMADPADVAKDGYSAFMSGSDKVISGFKNKIEVAMGNITPDRVVAHNIAQQQKPVDEEGDNE